jgi:hypothetical protein
VCEARGRAWLGHGRASGSVVGARTGGGSVVIAQGATQAGRARGARRMRLDRLIEPMRGPLL